MDWNDAHDHMSTDDTLYRVIAALFVVCGLVGAIVALSPATQRLVRAHANVAAVVTAALVDMANTDRAAHGAGTLAVDPVLQAAAQHKADDMAAKGYFAHFDASGKGPWDWMREAGYVYQDAGENLAIQFTESADVEQAWLDSPTHRQNLLNPRFTEVGIATAEGFYGGRPTTFVAQFFGRPAPTLAVQDVAEPAVQHAEPVPVHTARVATIARHSVKDVSVLGVVTSDSTPAHASTTPVAASLLFVPQAAAPTLPITPTPPHAWWERLSSMPSGMPRTLLALIALFATCGLGYLMIAESIVRHVRHTCYAASFSTASFAIVLLCLSVPSADPILDQQPVAFMSNPSARVAYVIPVGEPTRVAHDTLPSPVSQAAAAAVSADSTDKISVIIGIFEKLH